MKKTTITKFINTEYRQFFDHINQDKNAVLPYEGLLAVERHILYAGKMLPGFNKNNQVLTRKLASDTGLYHVSGEASVQDTIKSMASSYKRQHEVMLLKGVGAFPTSLSNTGAAARYTHVSGCPLSDKIFEDTDFFPHFVDDSGVVQPQYIVPPMPLAVIRTMKNIGVGKSAFICERPHDQVFDWVRNVIDTAYPGKSSGYPEKFYKEIKDSGVVTSEEIREFETTAKHKKIDKDTMDKIYAMDPPEPFMHTGCNVTYDAKKHVVWMEAKIEIVKNHGTKYYITDLPLEVSDKAVMKKIRDKFGDKMMEKVIDRSGEDHPIYLEIPKSIYNDKDSWSAIGLRKAFTEQYTMWDEELNAPRIYNNLHIIPLQWYQKREEIVSRRIFREIALNLKKIHNNNLIKMYFEYDQDGKIKTEDDVKKLFPNGDDASYLTGLPERTYIKSNVDKLQDLNKELEKKCKKAEKDLMNLKEYIFNEWRTVADENKEFFKNEI